MWKCYLRSTKGVAILRLRDVGCGSGVSAFPSVFTVRVLWYNHHVNQILVPSIVSQEVNHVISSIHTDGCNKISRKIIKICFLKTVLIELSSTT